MTAERPDARLPEVAAGPEYAITVRPQTTDPAPASSDVASASIPAATPLPPPSAFGRYQVQRTLGAGGFGAVYLALDSQLNRPVAIKVLHARSSHPQADVESALQEARKLAQMRHPGIVTVHDVGIHDEQVYIVSDFLEGADLGSWLRSNRPPWTEAARIAAAVADALAHAHARFIVHRDVKPGNILLTAERQPVLVDFGLALGDDQAGGSEKGSVSGTPWYMSPEQVEGSAHRIDGRTDIYSLGVVLYEMLTGRVPFRAADISELLRQVHEDEPQPPRQLVRELPPELEAVCLKALAKRQQDRYTTAADFAEALTRILSVAQGGSVSWRLPAGSSPGDVVASTPSSARSQALSSSSTSQRSQRGAENRHLTVLACGCDLFESENYLELDVEEQADVLREFQQTCEDAVRQFNGTIVQRNEQGLVACFGYPVAFEDAARRAARTGLVLLDELKMLGEKLLRQKQLAFQPWIGIHTGPAVVELKEGVISLVGEARNVALRLGDQEAFGQVICTQSSHRLFHGRFHCPSLGSHKIKGIAHPIELFRIERVAVAGNLIEAVAPSELSPLTGRDLEMGLLKERWEQAQEGMGQIVLLVAEPGLGKSRLVFTMKQHVLGQMVEGQVDAPVIEWRCSPRFQHTGLYPAIDFYERALGLGREDSPQVRFDRLLQRLEQDGLAQPDTVPLWASMLSIPTPDRFPSLQLSPARQREETFRVMLDWLRARARHKPILFVIEDLHWVDASTLEFLELFFAEGLDDSILTLLTFRPEFRPPWPSVAHQTSLSLNRLTRRQVRDLMTRKINGDVQDSLVDQIYNRTAGVPLFVEEFIKTVRESSESEGTHSDESKPSSGREIPATLQELVMARLDRMEGERQVAQMAATLGREFSYELLAAVETLDEEVLQSELAKLIEGEILSAKGRPPRCSYIFKHTIFEDALYNSLVKITRQQFHRRIAEVLEAQFPQTVETCPEVLAHHFTEAGLASKGVAYWLKAGIRSRARSADNEAIGHLTKGLTILAALENSPARDDQEFQILSNLGAAYIAARGYAAREVEPVLLRARELCRQNDLAEQLLGVTLGMWEWCIVRGNLRRCVELAADGMALAERANDPGMLMEALFMPGVTNHYRGHFADARDYFEQALAQYDDPERTKFWANFSGHNASVTHRCYLALALWHLGYPDQALQLAREACALARTIGHPFSLGHALDFLAFLDLDCGLGSEALAAAEEEIKLGTEQGFPLWRALGTIHKGAALLLVDRSDEGLPLLLKGLADFRETGAEVRAPSYLCMLADAYLKSGRLHKAREEIDKALAIVEKNDDRCHEAELQRLKGELHVAEANDQAAEHCFQFAIETASRQHSQARQLRATTSLARLYRRQGRHEAADSLLAAAYSAYTEGFTTPDLVQVKLMLDART